MPNWVANRISVTGTDAELDRFVEQVKGADSKLNKEGDQQFHFGAFVHPSDEDLPYYLGEKQDEEPEGYEDWSHAEKLAHKLKFSGRDWYDWNVTNWGTKRDACQAEVERTAEGVSVAFDTAWSPPEPIFHAMVKEFPELEFDIWFEEEQGWGGELAGSAGEVSLVKEWDIPNSHAEYLALDREDSCNCAWADDKEDWYDDCPGKLDIFVQVTKVYRLSASNLADARTEYFEMETGEKELPTEEADFSSFVFVDEEGEPIDN